MINFHKFQQYQKLRLIMMIMKAKLKSSTILEILQGYLFMHAHYNKKKVYRTSFKHVLCLSLMCCNYFEAVSY